MKKSTLQKEDGNYRSHSQHSSQDYRRLTFVKPHEVDKQSARALPHIQRALDRGGSYSIHDVLSELRSGAAQLWLAESGDQVTAICITVLNQHPQSKSCLIWLCGGDEVRTWIKLLTHIEDWAKAEGCDLITLRGRAGWERMLPDYEKTKVILEKKLR